MSLLSGNGLVADGTDIEVVDVDITVTISGKSDPTNHVRR